MKKHDLWIIVAAAVCAAALLIGSNFIDTTPKNAQQGIPEGVTLEFTTVAPTASGSVFSRLFASANAEEAPTTDTPAEPAEEEKAADDSSAQSAEKIELAPVDLDEEMIAKLEAAGLVRAESYLVVWFGEYYYYGPFPLLEEFEGQQARLSVSDSDYIVISLGKNHFNMAESSCPDQICITEGEVTLDNRENRLLGSCVYCLPNQITLEMRSPQEALDLLEATAKLIAEAEEMQNAETTAEAANEEKR